MLILNDKLISNQLEFYDFVQTSILPLCCFMFSLENTTLLAYLLSFLSPQERTNSYNVIDQISGKRQTFQLRKFKKLWS